MRSVILLATTLLFSLIPFSSSFLSHTFLPSSQSSYSTLYSSTPSVGADLLPSPSESAAALRAYMVKSLANSVSKDEEIRLLKLQLGSGLTSSLPPPASDPDSVQVLKQKIAAYQAFVEKYVVDTHADKLRAVEEAVASNNREWRAKWDAAMGGTVVAAGEAKAPTTALGVAAGGGEEEINDLFKSRGLEILSGSSAGDKHVRWGEEEVRKIRKEVGGGGMAIKTKVKVASVGGKSANFGAKLLAK